VGTALLLGALSVPLQLWAVRIPLARARHNARLFMWLIGAMTLTTAAVVQWAEPGSLIAGTVLLIAVVAEIAVSVLFATSWQPLISYTLSASQRQFIIGRASAASGAALLVAVVVFGELERSGRAVFLAVIGLTAFVVAWALRILPPPPNPAHTPTVDTFVTPERAEEPGPLTNVFIALPASAFASWPLLVTYAATVLWPDGNLGILAGSMSLGAVVALALWRDPAHRLLPLLRVAAMVVAICTAIIVGLDKPVDSGPAVGILLGAAAVGSAARSTLRTGILELAHRRIDTSNSVRIMTMIDVVASTSFQVGAFVAGLLIAASIDSTAAVDPYQVWLLVSAAALVVAAARFRPAMDR
jgi:hypothetical protein